ncbi:thioredoxin reductase [Mycoplasmopsis gallinacea]|uniref:Thioredoxin reductase n=1 Tax=Mycoplasmopsis gallinacea TaxID=29556 RepID=A0A0D5ZK64_9BACT|nr:thioredoxin reductase [Mycoplasmopsis gallinacea]
MSKLYDIAIIGGGPAGLNAALYASRANLNVVFIEKGAPGGKLSSTSKVDNWIGTETIEGWQLALNFFEHSKKYGAEYKYGNVVELKNLSKFHKQVILQNGEVVEAKTVIIASGMQNRVPSFINNFNNYLSKGVSFCAICDGPLFGHNPTLVLGGGNSAVEESIYLSKIASEVHIVTKDPEFTAEKRLVNDLLKLPNVKVYYESTVKELQGGEQLEKAIIVDKDGNEHTIDIASFFSYIGMIPNADFIKDLGITNEKGFIITDEEMQTKIEGIFAAGDIRVKEIRQIVTAANDGAIAAKKISDLINSMDN